MIRRFWTGVGLAVALVASGAQAAPDVAKMTSGELTAFSRAMPKGGELHNHLSGAIFAETLLAWAVEDGLCINVKTLSVTPPCQPGEDLKPASAIRTDEVLYAAMIDSFSVRHAGFRDRSGHDQFFGAFGRFGAAGARREGDMLANVVDNLARQNTFYLEAMVTPQGVASRVKGAQVGWKGGDLAAQKAANTAVGLEALVAVAMAETDVMEARARSLMRCGAPDAMPGCQVTVRYLVQTSRAAPPEQTFAQLQLGVALIAADKRWVGLQMVAPEDHPLSITHYSLHMRMVDFLTDHGRTTKAALHAGELSMAYATPEELRYHIAEAVRVAGARRIGHGVDLPLETDAEGLAAEMAAKGILVEVNLSSNDAILGVSGQAHPYAWLRRRGVPVSLSTDDAGILRIDLSHEYARAADEGATYADLRTSARNAIAFSFLTGEGLWADPGAYRHPAKACARQIGKAEPKPGGCADLIAASDKAREQWRHERLLATFEAAAR
ncbi:adenosine deaminase [Phenylobacterium sp.]|uniref:adenosine deaminase family protein n=1 Tax=Phenylobacterium sp. TaxID=1871053 RepID=UPI0030F3EB07